MRPPAVAVPDGAADPPQVGPPPPGIGSVPHPAGPATTYRPPARTPLRVRLRRKVADLAGRWRSSLIVRVVSTTIVGGALALAVLGGVIANQIRDSLYDERVTQMLEDAAVRTRDAQQTFDSATATTTQQVQLVVVDWVDALETASSGAVGTFLMRSPENTAAVTIAEPSTNAAPREVLSAELRDAVVDEGGLHWQPVRLPGDEPGIIVGSLVTLPAAGEYELYTVYTLAPEEETVYLVLRVLAVGASSLVLVLGAMVWAIARWVLRPVQQAAFAAERLADGRLDERMEVRGGDELAVLGESFNEMAASLQRQIERMEELSRLQQRFVSDVSHELRTPLTTIRMAGELIHDARGSFDPAVRRSAELLHAQLDRFETMLADLLEISRFDAGAAVLDVEERDVRDLVARVVDLDALLAERKGSEVRVHAPAEPCTADVDPRRVERILRNLLGNAIEHGEGRPIDITVGCSDGAVAVVVRDHGVGLGPEDAEHVFDRFWRADPARARTSGGTGLGLSISAEDARLHGGRLEAWGEPGLGAAFRLTLPRRAGAEVGRSPVPLRPGELVPTAGATSLVTLPPAGLTVPPGLPAPGGGTGPNAGTGPGAVGGPGANGAGEAGPSGPNGSRAAETARPNAAGGPDAAARPDASRAADAAPRGAGASSPAGADEPAGEGP
ncbi:MtrAB system histidine kinase MtrB [Georgenia sp. TF02-10]|uniref:MtrAB system histidine kinase MtrB n=1 Tax=Georgenia sp. TF02-10 TaxID=2917725 RepID=UPI001FA766A8|nr:MtrAB system histidine kinase MtrB [Georgenia sp. TF02-10]UNX55814.1 MtrAB system histidine kinase MtrB [Georgenia sp. TF02-10]